MKTEIQLNHFYTDGEFTGLATSVNKGWVTLVDADGNEAKFRAKELEPCSLEGNPNSMSNKLARYRKGYIRVRTPNGTTFHNGDPVATAMQGMELGQVYQIGSMLLKVPQHELVAKYEHLNYGSQRMNIGNRLRSLMKKGDADVVAWATK